MPRVPSLDENTPEPFTLEGLEMVMVAGERVVVALAGAVMVRVVVRVAVRVVVTGVEGRGLAEGVRVRGVETGEEEMEKGVEKGVAGRGLVTEGVEVVVKEMEDLQIETWVGGDDHRTTQQNIHRDFNQKQKHETCSEYKSLTRTEALGRSIVRRKDTKQSGYPLH